MLRIASLARSLQSGVTRSSFLVLMLALGHSGAASAAIWHDGQFINYSQGNWGDDPSPGSAAALLQANYNTVYAPTSGLLEVGIPGAGGYSILFTNVTDLLNFLPTLGPSGPLTSDLLDPTSSAAGAVAGRVIALQLDIDFSDAGVLPGAPGLRFGDLILTNFTTLPLLNGLTVRQFRNDVNILLGGGSSIYTIATLDLVVDDVSSAFGGGGVSSFAEDHLMPPAIAVAEPNSLLLFGLGVLGLTWVRRRKQ